jgi:hypothetical protein
MKLVRCGGTGQERPGVLAEESHAYEVSDLGVAHLGWYLSQFMVLEPAADVQPEGVVG